MFAHIEGNDVADLLFLGITAIGLILAVKNWKEVSK